MKNIHYFNTTVYLIVIAIYLYQPVYGALSQIGLGILQLVLAIRLSLDLKEFKPIGRKALRIYWYTVLVWFISFLILIFGLTDEHYVLVFVYIVPMSIGLYFVLVTYLTYKHQK